MDDYIRRKDAIRETQYAIVEMGGNETIKTLRTIAIVKASLKMVPAADVVQVVRCKDCKNSYQNQFEAADKTVECTLLRNSCGWPVLRREDDYCSDGEPKGGSRGGRE